MSTDYTTNLSSRQIARLLSWCLIPAVVLGALGTLGALMTPLVILIAPLFGVGLYIYIGYTRIVRSTVGQEGESRIWLWSALYNGLLIMSGLYLLLIEGVDNPWMLLATMFGQAAVLVSSLTARNRVSGRNESLEGMIAKIGAPQS